MRLDCRREHQPTLERFLRARGDGLGSVRGKVYRHLLRLNRGFDAVTKSLNALRKYEAFDTGELKRMRDRAEETRASANSYLTAALETMETDEAGRLFRKTHRPRTGG